MDLAPHAPRQLLGGLREEKRRRRRNFGGRKKLIDKLPGSPASASRGLRRWHPGRGVPRHGRGQAGSPRVAAETRDRPRRAEEGEQVHQMGRGEVLSAESALSNAESSDQRVCVFHN